MSLVSRLVNLSGHIDPGVESQVLADYNEVYENWARENSFSESVIIIRGFVLFLSTF